MLEFIVNIDKSLFYFFNVTLSNPVFDVIFPFITNQKNWYPIYIATFLWLFIKSGKKGRLCGIALILTVILSDQISSTFIKEMVGRLRPCHTLEGINLLVPCGGGKSFPSSHAVNNFAAASVLIFYYRKQWWIFLILAALVGFSRIYCGVHYPFDILGGAIIGYLLGFVFPYVIKYIDLYFTKKIRAKRNETE